MFKRIIDFLMKSMIELGQALLKLDGIGVDALIIGFVVIGLIQIRARINERAHAHEEKKCLKYARGFTG